MRGTNKLLLAIIAGSVLLVVAALAVMLLRPEPTYQSEATPEGVAHNYLLALKSEDYPRAYGYLSDTIPGYPATLEEFDKAIDRNYWGFRIGADTTISIQSTKVSEQKAVVTVQEIRFYRGGLFDSGEYISTFEITLVQSGNQWKIFEADNYFAWCWSDPGGCNY
jgi:hypothetical protein